MFNYLFDLFINHLMFNFRFVNLCSLYYLNGHLDTQNSIIYLFYQKSFVKTSVAKVDFTHLFARFLRTNPITRYFKEVKSVQEVNLKDVTD